MQGIRVIRDKCYCDHGFFFYVRYRGKKPWLFDFSAMGIRKNIQKSLAALQQIDIRRLCFLMWHVHRKFSGRYHTTHQVRIRVGKKRFVVGWHFSTAHVRVKGVKWSMTSHLLDPLP